MKQQKISKLNNEELLKLQKSIKVITYMLAATLLFLFCLTLFLTIKNGFNALTIIPVALLPTVFLNLNNLKEIKKELKSRESLK